MSSTYPPTQIALIVLGLIALTMSFASSADLKAGFSERDITPEIPDTWVDVDDNAQLIRRWILGSTGTGTVNLTLCGWRASKITGLHKE